MLTEPTGQEPYTPVKVKDTSATERAAFRKCRRQWFLSVVHRLQSVEGNTNFWLGTIIHSALETYYRALMSAGWDSSWQSDAWDQLHAGASADALATFEEEYGLSLVPMRDYLGSFLWANVEPTYYEMGQLGYRMVQDYLEHERRDPIFDEVLEVENRVEVPIRSPGGSRVGTLSVMADLVGRRAGYLSVADHKTASREVSESQLDLDDQLTAEAYAIWQSRGEFPEEVVYNGLMKRVADPPKRLKDGKGGLVKLSRDKNQATTYELYKAELAAHGLPVADYADILEHFYEIDRTGESRFFKRIRVLRSESQVASFQSNLYQEWKDIRAVAAHPERAYPNPSAMSCPSCPVKLVCMTLQDEGDSEAVIKAGFAVGEPRR